ncbi:2-octaprenyl-6-methoxyphenyl hydroxylase [Vibrio spartinae]|uniref:2-octaprenyl-6-methoxyphenol hydroxylase n=1 Tax=Vibrio spartinae TaxID=1918945 RepID=A0A1N6M3Y1_9VIBR|nr:2-octaprenyl-6-methoxyphenyl hydroxylase [Vibrio spartinae]QMV13273.1 2-octaprenyl-6-methoxyphenol hydroxylase [Vibrio spartinae]SIO94153.1 2-octaprenyl-6-methoxyphenol hydroxylase [Vibrio spartinae]
MKMFDVIISGGAMAGATLALALDASFGGKLRIAVVESCDFSTQAHPGFDARSIALSDGTVQILQAYQLWDAIQPYATPISSIHISDRGHAGMTDLEANRLGMSALGYVVELADVGQVYHRLLQERAAISLFCPATIQSVERTTDEVQVQLADQSTLRGKLLIAADGNTSTCCHQLGITSEVRDFEQVAVIANVELDQPHQGQAFERFTTSGPLALLPMSRQRMAMAWCVRPDSWAEMLSQDDDTFLAKLQQTFGWRLGKMNRVGTRAAYPLKLTYRSRAVSHRFAIIGNAAQTLHPIAGQGFNLGIRDIATLVEEVRRHPDDVGCYAALSAFQQRRTPDRQKTMIMTSTLVHTFSNAWFPAVVGRNLGLMAIDNLPVLKQPLLTRTLGYVSR